MADSIFKEINLPDGDELKIDFGGVEEATPSFCHEMLVVLQDKGITPSFINANDSIKLQLNKAMASISG